MLSNRTPHRSMELMQSTLDSRLGDSSHSLSSQKKFASSAFVLSILENLYASDGDKNHPSPVFQELEKSVGEKKHSLKNAFLNIDPKEGQALQDKIGPGTFEALLSISQESDPQLFAEALLNIGKSLKKKLDEAKAGLIFQMLGQDSIPIKVREEAKVEYDAMVGQGATGLRVEHLGNRFFKDAADYKTIVPMLGSTALFSVVRTAAAAKLAASGAGIISQGLGLKIASIFIGSAVEIPAFALSGRTLHQLAGDQVRESVSDDLLSSGITLSLLKGFGFAGNKAFQHLHQVNELGLATRLAGISKFTQPLLSQSFMFGALLTGHKAEEKAGLRAHVDNATTVTDTLASMVSMGVGGHLGHQALGSGYAKFQHELEFRSQNAESNIEHRTSDIERKGKDEVRKYKDDVLSSMFYVREQPALASIAAVGTGLATFFGADFAHAAVQGGTALSEGGSVGLLKALGFAGIGVLGMAAIQRSERSGDAKTFELATALEEQGRRAGEAGEPLSKLLQKVRDPFAAPGDPLWQLLAGLREGTIKAPRGPRLDESVKQAADSFIKGALTLLGETKTPRFLKTTARAWAMEEKRKGKKNGNLSYANQQGEIMAAHLDHYLTLGLEGSLSRSLLSRRLHIRDIPSFLAARGWLEGQAAFLYRRGEQEMAEILQANRESIIYRALANGDLDYVIKVKKRLPQFLQSHEEAIAQAADDLFSKALQVNRGAIISHALASGDLDYIAKLKTGLPLLLQSLDEAITQATDDVVREALRADRGAIISEALRNGNFVLSKIFAQWKEGPKGLPSLGGTGGLGIAAKGRDTAVKNSIAQKSTSESVKQINDAMGRLFRPFPEESIQQVLKDLTFISEDPKLSKSVIGEALRAYKIPYWIKNGYEPFMVIHNTGADPIKMAMVLSGKERESHVELGAFPVTVFQYGANTGYYGRALNQFAITRAQPHLTLEIVLPASHLVRWLLQNKESGIKHMYLSTRNIPSLISTAKEQGTVKILALPGAIGTGWDMDLWNIVQKEIDEKQIQLVVAEGESFHEVYSYASRTQKEEATQRWAQSLIGEVHQSREQLLEGWANFALPRVELFSLIHAQTLFDDLENEAKAAGLVLPPPSVDWLENVRKRLADSKGNSGTDTY
jgi:hypothetical protein